MATQSQIDANRRNAQKSTGPNTPEGRAAVRHNALKHGLTSQLLLPSKEEQIELARLCDAFETEFQPVGPTEESLLENLVAAKWRLGFARKAETGFFMKRAFELINDETSDCRDLLTNSRLAMIVNLDSAGPDTLSKLSRYEARLERSFYKALSELRRTQSQREPAEPRAAKHRGELQDDLRAVERMIHEGEVGLAAETARRARALRHVAEQHAADLLALNRERRREQRVGCLQRRRRDRAEGGAARDRREGLRRVDRRAVPAVDEAAVGIERADAGPKGDAAGDAVRQDEGRI